MRWRRKLRSSRSFISFVHLVRWCWCWYCAYYAQTNYTHDPNPNASTTLTPASHSAYSRPVPSLPLVPRPSFHLPLSITPPSHPLHPSQPTTGPPTSPPQPQLQPLAAHLAVPGTATPRPPRQRTRTDKRPAPPPRGGRFCGARGKTVGHQFRRREGERGARACALWCATMRQRGWGRCVMRRAGWRVRFVVPFGVGSWRRGGVLMVG